MGTNALPAPIQEQKSLTAEQVDDRLRQLEQQAPGFSFRNRDVVRNRYNRSSVSVETKQRRLMASVLLELQEHRRELKCRPIDEQWLDLYAQRYRILLADRRRKRCYEDEEEEEEERNTRPLRRRRLRRHRMNTQEEEETTEEADNCPVCLNTLDTGAVTRLTCGHALHADCHVQLLANRQDHRCPTCRACMTCVGDCNACQECHLHGQHTGTCSRYVPGTPDSTASLNEAISGLQT